MPCAAFLIAQEIKQGVPNQDEKQIEALIAGLEARQRGINLSSEDLNVFSRLIEKERLFLSQKNLTASEHWLKQLTTDDNIHFVVPSKLGYLAVKEGTGNTLTNENGHIIANYIIKKFDDFFPEAAANRKSLNLSEVIPGLAQGMLGMKEGEIRTIYIHPDYAYANSYLFDPNVGIEATIELVSILSTPSTISPLPIPMQKSLPNISQDEITTLRLRNSYVLGWKLWDHLRWGDKQFSLHELIKYLRSNETVKLPLEWLDEINRIHWNLYQAKKQSVTG
ncbi:FKBP-type peptidyl-prolyl cis-trans isomerase [Parachlamydia acanthamoebae]|nr:FKBP-type peptidyl-prolyl cis-trans isomerase [Parachlamydia acanthamoebae]EFB40906.1 hypothetical protein pah_c180o104 [Parachlamydia acanthamoebae str. Hall's coccus]